MVTYPGDPTVSLERAVSLDEGGAVNLSRLDFGVHTGTHVDAPLHFISGAAATETLALETLIGPARVLDLTAADHLDASTFDGCELGTRVLLKTKNSELWERDDFAEDFLALDESAARRLVAEGVRLVGIDYLSIGDEDAHKVLLGAGIVAVEGLDLREAEPGEYEVLCLPMKIAGSDGAPARVVLRRSGT